MVWRFAPDPFEQRVQDGENLDIAVIVDSRDAVGFQVEGIDHVHVGKIRRGCFVSDVDRVLQRKVPDGEGFKLRVSGFQTAAVFVIDLAQAGGHFPAARPRRGHDDEGMAGFDIVVAAEAFVGNDMAHVGGIAGNGIMSVHAHAQGGETVFKLCGCTLVGIPGQDHGADIKAEVPESVDQAQHVQVVCDAQIAADFTLLDIVGVDDDDHFDLILELREHPDFRVWRETRQDAGGMVIVKQFAAEFQVQLAAEALNALCDMRRLQLVVFILIKSDSHSGLSSSFCADGAAAATQDHSRPR